MSSNIYRDMTMDSSKVRPMQVFWDKKVKKLCRKTKFSEYELQALCLIFHKICQEHEWWGKSLVKDRVDRLDRTGFRDGTSALMDMSETEALQALFSAQDPDNKRYTTAARWIRTLDHARGTQLDKAKLCWKAYLKTEGNKISRSDMAVDAKTMFLYAGVDDLYGFSKEFVDAILRNTNAGKQGAITRKEYLDLAVSRPLFTEFLRTVLPSRDAFSAFLATFSPPDLRPRRRRR